MATKDGEAQSDELPPTALARLVAEAKEKLQPKPDRHGPAAVRAMAAVVRDLKGMPDLVVTRESAARLRIGRRGRVGFLVIAYDAGISTMEVSIGGFSELAGTVGTGSVRYALHGEAWLRMDGGDELFADLHAHMLRLYPELG